jgi:hypothetical protein
MSFLRGCFGRPSSASDDRARSPPTSRPSTSAQGVAPAPDPAREAEAWLVKTAVTGKCACGSGAAIPQDVELLMTADQIYQAESLRFFLNEPFESLPPPIQELLRQAGLVGANAADCRACNGAAEHTARPQSPKWLEKLGSLGRARPGGLVDKQ